MKNQTNNIIVLGLLLLVSFSCGKKQDESKQKDNSSTKYIAYYFHPTARCEGCLNMESFLEELIDTKYSKEGFIFTELNIEDKENQHYRKDYDLKFSSVILAKYEGDKQSKWKNLDSVWSFTEKKEEFFRYTEKEINQFINN